MAAAAAAAASSPSAEPAAKRVKVEATFEGTVTVTFGDQAENHVGMQKIGQLAEAGFSVAELEAARHAFAAAGATCELIDLGAVLGGGDDDDDGQVEAPEAAVLVVRKGVDLLLKTGGGDATALYREQYDLPYDRMARMYGRVVNKHARWNLCFDEAGQEPDYEAGKGRIIAYKDIPLTQHVRNALPQFLGPKAAALTGEGNKYYDPKTTGIGFHGDSERRKVVAIRLGVSTPLHYQWFQHGKPVGARVKLNLNHGDLYIMSEKATGHDWKRSAKIPTLRHAAGCEKFLTIKNEKSSKE